MYVSTHIEHKNNSLNTFAGSFYNTKRACITHGCAFDRMYTETRIGLSIHICSTNTPSPKKIKKKSGLLTILNLTNRCNTFNNEHIL